MYFLVVGILTFVLLAIYCWWLDDDLAESEDVRDVIDINKTDCDDATESQDAQNNVSIDSSHRTRWA